MKDRVETLKAVLDALDSEECKVRVAIVKENLAYDAKQEEAVLDHDISHMRQKFDEVAYCLVSFFSFFRLFALSFFISFFLSFFGTFFLYFFLSPTSFLLQPRM